MIQRIFVLFLCLIFLPLADARADVDIELEKQIAYQYLNQIREAAGMNPFKKNENLQNSAHNHARYLSINRVIGHFQDEGYPEYTGSKPDDRAIFAGYETRSVTENTSFGQKNSFESIEGLMSAIYHRFGFLDFSKDEVGISLVKAGNGFNFVYNMGNERQNHFCRYAIYTKEGSYYKDACRQQNKVDVEKFDKLEQETLKSNPSVIIWPPDRAKHVLNAFYEEIPDPLPGLSVSGYPVSIQFNPFYFKLVKLLSFKLFRTDDNRIVEPVHLMHKRNDPNHKLTEFQFALFPLKRLEWGKKYRAEAVFETDNGKQNKIWTFTAKELPYPMFVIRALKDFLLMKPNRTYAVYVPPASRLPFIEQLQWETASTLQSDVIWEDRNTILVKLSGEKCRQASFSLNGNRSFTVQLADKDNLNAHHYYPQKTALSCVLSTVKDMPGYRIKGRGEMLEMQVDRDYWIAVESDRNVTADINMRYFEGMSIQVKHLSQNIIKVRLSGHAGQKATFFLSDSKSFKVKLINE